MARAFYNENAPYAAEWLRQLIAAQLIPAGTVDERSIADLDPEELRGYTQVHLFAGLGGWPYALRLAGWPDDRPILTGSAPCQPFSVAGKRAGADDPRHLWPHMLRILSALRPPVVMGEQVAGAAGYGWLDGVHADLEAQGYTCEAADIPACSVNAPHIRNRLYWLAHPTLASSGTRLRQTRPLGYRDGSAGAGPGAGGLGNTNGTRPEEWQGIGRNARTECEATERSGGADGGMGDAAHGGRGELWQPSWEDGLPHRHDPSAWDEWILVGPDPAGKYRRTKPGVCLLASRVPSRVSKLRALGNCIIPQEAAEVIRAYMETYG